MRTLCLAFVTAGVIFAQDAAPVAVDPAMADALKARAMELLRAAQAERAKPGIQLNSLRIWRPLTPGTPAPYAAAGSVFPGKCAVPLLEMAVPPGIDSIAHPPTETNDRIGAVMGACSEVMAVPPAATPPAAPPTKPSDTPVVGPLVKAP